MKITFIVSIVLALATNPLSAQSLPDKNRGLTEKLDAIASDALTADKIPGMSIAVSLNNKMIYSNAFGFADLEHSVRCTPETRFRTASIAKPITATAALKLAELGKLDLDAPIQKYCASFPKKKWDVTVRQLLGHLGGIRHYNKPGESVGKNFHPTLIDSLKLFKDDPLLHQPGSKYSYSTFGYSLLGCAIETASGLSFEDSLKTQVFDPAGMTSTHLDHARYIIPNRSRGYMMMTPSIHKKVPNAIKNKFKVGKIYNAPLHDTSMKVPGGGLLSTSEDLIRFVIALNANKLLKQETREMMLTCQSLSNGTKTDYGLGWKLEQDNGGPLLISHSGSQAGTSTFLVMIPKFKLVVAVMCNLEDISAKNIARSIGMAVIQHGRS